MIWIKFELNCIVIDIEWNWTVLILNGNGLNLIWNELNWTDLNWIDWNWNASICNGVLPVSAGFICLCIGLCVRGLAWKKPFMWILFMCLFGSWDDQHFGGNRVFLRAVGLLPGLCTSREESLRESAVLVALNRWTNQGFQQHALAQLTPPSD